MPARDAQFAPFDSPIGRFWLSGTAAGVLLITRSETPESLLAALAARRLSPMPDDLALSPALAWMEAYFAGARPRRPALDLSGVPAFDAAVYRAAMAIPYGATASYGEVAAVAESPRAARAAGGAMARCPLFPLVPCHRVIHADGSIGGWGPDLWVKRWLLDHERRD
jgi:methylated-DNA-[protein]-cysteine S-methyltransferase